MALAEVFLGCSVADAAGGGPQQLFEQTGGVGARHSMHGVKRQGEVAADQVANLIKVEQLLHQGDEVIDAVDHLNLHGTDRVQTGCLQRDRWGLHDRVLLQGLGAVIDRIGERSRRWSTVGTVHLHTEVAVCPAGVVGGGQDDSADGLALANQIGGGRSGEDSSGGHDHFAEAMGCSHAQDHIDGATVAVTTIAPQDQGSPLHTRQGSEHGFNEALQVVRLLELPAAFTEARRAGFLVGERSVELDQVLGRFHGGRGGHHWGWFFRDT